MIAAFSGLGLLAAGTTMLVRRLNPVAMVIGSLSFFLSGVLYPVTVLPDWLRAVGRLLPLTHTLAVLRGALLVGASPAALADSFVALIDLRGRARAAGRRRVRLRPPPRAQRRLAVALLVALTTDCRATARLCGESARG